MSIVDDQVRRLDAALDRIQLLAAEQDTSVAESDVIDDASPDAVSKSDNATVVKIKALIRSLSTTAASRPLLKRARLRETISQIKVQQQSSVTTLSADDDDLVWLAIGKATVQVYGIILNALLDQTIPLSESIWYWDDILGSYAYTGLYTLQTSPIRFYHSSKAIYYDATRKWQENRSIAAASAPPPSGSNPATTSAASSLSAGWREFYDLVGKSIEARSLALARTKILSPFAICRTEARRKQEQVKKLREQSAAAIGLLVEEGLNFQVEDWKDTIVKGVRLLEGVTTHTQNVRPKWTELEEQLAGLLMQPTDEVGVAELVDNLLHIVDEHIPQQEKESQTMVREFGIPPKLVRYWIPGVLLLLSGSTLLRVFFKRRQEILNWIRELGSTAIDFWYNWVVDPTKRLIGTIRHDENSELAIMSKDSLLSDRDSLERMVVDFATENPVNGTYTEAQLDEIRTQVRKGDLSTVMIAYEKDMQSPAKNALFGNLIRSLLIQIQKTKVDVEVAMNGIDEILKSQELLFGMVGIAPGILVSWFAYKWLGSTFGGRRGLRAAQQQGDTVRLLRNIDRTLSNAVATEDGMLSYKDNGLLLCEIHVLRQTAARVIPSSIFNHDFLEDVRDLMNVNQGIEKQLRVVARLDRAYGKWLR